MSRALVTLDDITEALIETGADLSRKNAANFMKDLIRPHKASNSWPEELKRLRIGGRQVTGGGRAFKFIPYSEGQTEPFPNPFGYHSDMPVHFIESVSMSQANKALGRDDETYLIQVALRLRLVETHFALKSPLNIAEVSHLQIGIKLRRTEIDSLYSAVVQNEEGQSQILITTEAKRRGQRILAGQVMQQVHAAFAIGPDYDTVVPLAMTSAEGGVYVAEFKAVHRSAITEFASLELETEAYYRFVPPVPGISPKLRRRAKSKLPSRRRNALKIEG